MSAIPPNWLSSIIQTHGAQQRAADAQSKDQADAAERAGRTDPSAKAPDVIENTDRDSQVYADAEGTGSQGRPFDERSGTAQDSADSDDSSSPGLDVRA